MLSVKTFARSTLIALLSISLIAASLIRNPAEHTQTISQKAFYLGTGTSFIAASSLARLAWGLCLMSPWSSTLGNEFLLLSDLCSSITQHAFAQIFKKPPDPVDPSLADVPFSQSSWYLNQKLLSAISAPLQEEKQLLLFLERRWLSKQGGFDSFAVDWVYPCFGIFLQTHPETSHCYVRDPNSQPSQTYEKRVEEWKNSLPHPLHFPLILTRPSEIQSYLPRLIEFTEPEKGEDLFEELASKMEDNDTKVIVDFTRALPEKTVDQNEWMKSWETHRTALSQKCKEASLDSNRIICIQRIKQGDVGGIRILPLADETQKWPSKAHHQFLLEWISHFGLTANQIELDRWNSSPPVLTSETTLCKESPSKEAFIAYLDSFDRTWASSHPQKTLLLKGTLHVLIGLFAEITNERWDQVMACPTQSAVVRLSLNNIQNILTHSPGEGSFFDTASRVEEIHANLCSLLEIFSPFLSDDFPLIYLNLLTSIPKPLKHLTTCGLHSSGMTSIAGIFKAVEKTAGASPRILYGENAYFECIYAAQQATHACAIDEATEEDFKEADLILAQFNPALRRIDYKITAYRIEKIAETIHQALRGREERPLTVAIDCTFDFIDSRRVGKLLDAFQDQIEQGTLNIICYRSGSKFDLFGMDNYCGGPFYMIHNEDPKWAAFDALSTDPALQTDRLSLNWFCLAYKNASSDLELYRKQIFDNTRELLDKIPPRLYNQAASYRMIPIEEEADPSFIDFKVFGPLHQIRASALVGGSLLLQSMKGGHPIFNRRSIGYYHSNFGILFGPENSTIRLTLGLDPAQIDLFAKCFAEIDRLNGPAP